MSNQVNNAGRASHNAQPEPAETGKPDTPDNIENSAAEFASLMEGEPKATSRKATVPGKQGGESPSESSLSEDAGHFADSFSRPTMTKSEAQNQFADGRSAAMAKDPLTEKAAHESQSLTDTGDADGTLMEKPQTSVGDSILQSFGGPPTEKAAQPNAASGVSESKAATAGDTIAEVSQTIADRILVSDPAHGGDAEVRIMMKDSVLPGTEVRITEQNGELQIQFHTDSPESRDMLAKHQTQMTERLNERLERNVAVDIEFDSKGQGDQQGRSRQQRDLIDELNERE